MVEMKNINARVNELKATNKAIKNDPSFDISNAQQFFQLRNLMQEVRQEMRDQLYLAIWNYETPKEINGWTAEHIRQNVREMFDEAQKWGLEDMRLCPSHVVEINGEEFCIILGDKELTISEFAGDHRTIGHTSFDSNYQMVNFYFNMVDNNFEVIRDFYDEYLKTGEDVITLYFEAAQEPHYAEYKQGRAYLENIASKLGIEHYVVVIDESVYDFGMSLHVFRDEEHEYPHNSFSIDLDDLDNLGEPDWDELREYLVVDENETDRTFATAVQENFDAYNDNLKMGTEFFEKAVKEMHYEFYEIVEDSYEFNNGLLLIIYDDKECENEIHHCCIDLDNPHLQEILEEIEPYYNMRFSDLRDAVEVFKTETEKEQSLADQINNACFEKQDYVSDNKAKDIVIE